MIQQPQQPQLAAKVPVQRAVIAPFKEVPILPQDHNCSWFWKAEQLRKGGPSRRDGFTYAKEMELRKKCITFLNACGKELGLQMSSLSTSHVFLHRYYALQSFADQTFDPLLAATCCLFVACKVEETPKQVKEILFVTAAHRFPNDPAMVERIKNVRDEYERQKDLIMTGERRVLTTLGFDLNVKHPYKSLLMGHKMIMQHAKEMAELWKRELQHGKVPKEDAYKAIKACEHVLKPESSLKLKQYAWNFVNDTYKDSTMCLTRYPMHIAVGALYLGMRFLKLEIPMLKNVDIWYSKMVDEMTKRAYIKQEIEEMCHELLAMYDKPQPQKKRQSQPQQQQQQSKIEPPERKPTPKPATPDDATGSPQGNGQAGKMTVEPVAKVQPQQQSVAESKPDTTASGPGTPPFRTNGNLNPRDDEGEPSNKRIKLEH